MKALRKMLCNAQADLDSSLASLQTVFKELEKYLDHLYAAYPDRLHLRKGLAVILVLLANPLGCLFAVLPGIGVARADGVQVEGGALST